MKLERCVGVAGFLSAWVAQGAAAQADPAAARAAVDAETLRHFQALVRMDTTSPPGNEKPAADYVAQVLAREGIPVQTFAVEAHRPNVVARLTGNGTQAAAVADGSYRHRERRPRQVAAPAVQRRARRRAHLWPRHRRRQGQRDGGAHDDADAEAQPRAARSRRDLPRRSRRGGQHGGRHRVHGRAALRRDRRRVLPRRGR